MSNDGEAYNLGIIAGADDIIVSEGKIYVNSNFREDNSYSVLFRTAVMYNFIPSEYTDSIIKKLNLEVDKTPSKLTYVVRKKDNISWFKYMFSTDYLTLNNVIRYKVCEFPKFETDELKFSFIQGLFEESGFIDLTKKSVRFYYRYPCVRTYMIDTFGIKDNTHRPYLEFELHTAIEVVNKMCDKNTYRYNNYMKVLDPDLYNLKIHK